MVFDWHQPADAAEQYRLLRDTKLPPEEVVHCGISGKTVKLNAVLQVHGRLDLIPPVAGRLHAMVQRDGDHPFFADTAADTPVKASGTGGEDLQLIVEGVKEPGFPDVGRRKIAYRRQMAVYHIRADAVDQRLEPPQPNKIADRGVGAFSPSAPRRNNRPVSPPAPAASHKTNRTAPPGR